MARQKQSPSGELPKLRSPDEAGAFWDTHSPEDYPDQFEQVQVRFARPLIKRGLTVKLSEGTIDELRVLAEERGIGPSTLARMWIMEHLHAEQRRRGEQQV